MPVSPLSILEPNALNDYADLRSVPKQRFFGKNDLVDRFRLAVPFDHIIISGLDVDHYRFGTGFSIDTDLPPAFLEIYEADKLPGIDPFLQAGKNSRTVVVESEVYALHAPPPRLAYLQQTFGVHNRTLVPIFRNDIAYGAICYTRSIPFTLDEIRFLELVSELIHTAVTKPLVERFVADQIGLTKGELACLEAASRGLTSEAIAMETGFQSDTVNSYIKSSVKKLGATNRTQAIVEALRRRLIA
ncbi:DNA-binding CsgD family transcriptional regulator [Rhizobium sp. PP-F2F-G48]|uniref:helix-turn-helix transcriptional regulator n=1 Tax=Rhizobium sp. PP-F2F-G48 TaxID=2135651 RepID=UPI00104C7AA6|nr:LuxR family transcriptional regulator [Rhizobium sp. PP-F2F-G48]TCM58369.1 DNA-binding CsgD family transcriptional regulator [Rhizobium sp. PP-F2F-G48]